MKDKADEWGSTRRCGRLVMQDEKRAIQIEVDIQDENRLQVLLSRAMTAVAIEEVKVECMTDADVSKYLDNQAKHYVTMIPNDNP